jgi:hypothetical protein
MNERTKAGRTLGKEVVDGWVDGVMGGRKGWTDRGERTNDGTNEGGKDMRKERGRWVG